MDRVADGMPEEDVPLQPPENETPDLVKGGLNDVTVFLGQYGWYIIFAIVAFFFLKQKLQPKIHKFQKKREENSYYTRYDASTIESRQEAMMRARMRMQEEHDEKAKIAEEERKKKEEQKRQERIEDWDRHQQGKGYRSKYRPQEEPSPSTSGKKENKAPKPKLRQNDYNPLMGAGGGASFRRARRGGGG
ncbi:selenoprotein S-like [Saccoglossus kowalevskii]|uniref:Selenoprotein S-like n=1 Tax=Saccoglossus kowalevskii TaxID=10224 RepID=A0ABM0GW86_SACKO|nr:PREDICTED: selenoprotein S-like [Saccoglossus kowalevskii]